MADTRGVFGLRQVLLFKNKNEWVPLEDVWNGDPPIRFSDGVQEEPKTGYFGGGESPVKSTVDKTTYSSDTTAAVPGANLSLDRRFPVATGNSTHGYFGGGDQFTYTEQMDKVTYASDTTAAVPGANLTVARSNLAASSNSANGLPDPNTIPETFTNKFIDK